MITSRTTWLLKEQIYERIYICHWTGYKKKKKKVESITKMSSLPQLIIKVVHKRVCQKKKPELSRKVLKVSQVYREREKEVNEQ